MLLTGYGGSDSIDEIQAIEENEQVLILYLLKMER